MRVSPHNVPGIVPGALLCPSLTQAFYAQKALLYSKLKEPFQCRSFHITWKTIR
jgi:hypothetical protein